MAQNQNNENKDIQLLARRMLVARLAAFWGRGATPEEMDNSFIAQWHKECLELAAIAIREEKKFENPEI